MRHFNVDSSGQYHYGLHKIRLHLFGLLDTVGRDMIKHVMTWSEA